MTPDSMILGVVADDITGAGDIGSMTAKAGYTTDIHAFDGGRELNLAADVNILDTDSRFDRPEISYDKVHAATLALKDAGCPQFFNKTCSVFRGNIGPEFDAMLDALGEDVAVVVLGFPKNGRVTRNGIHYVHGHRLEDSDFRNDPMHPATKSDLVEILQAQTKRKVALVSHETIDQGPEALHGTLQGMRSQANYLILDVVDQAALSTIAQAVKDCQVLCGSSALAEVLSEVWGEAPKTTLVATPPPQEGLGVLCLAGSLTPQTRVQVAYLEASPTASFRLDAGRLFEPEVRDGEIGRLVDEVAARLERGQNVLVHTANGSRTLELTRTQGAARGLSVTDVARLVSGTLAEIAAGSQQRTGFSRLVVAGGDTSATVCRRLGISRMRVWQEIAPGLPSCLSLPDASAPASPVIHPSSQASMLLVLKSGSFGGQDFLKRAMDHVKEVQ